MHITTLPRTPGRDFAGVVTEGSSALVGKSVFGSGGNLGFGRDGSHAEFVTVPEAAVLPMPKGFTFEQAAVSRGVLRAAGGDRQGRTLAKGRGGIDSRDDGRRVGAQAARIARRARARVLGVVRKKADLARGQRWRTAGRCLAGFGKRRTFQKRARGHRVERART